MAVTVNTRDLINYPGNSKTVTIDIARLVPPNIGGDEQWVTSAATSAYSDNSASTAIQNIYCNNLINGFSKSSGFQQGPYTITSGSTDQLTVSVDGSAAREITLEAGTGLSGTTVAEDMETKLQALAATGQSEDGNLSFLNVIVTFSDGVFQIESGTTAEAYTGASRSSVVVTAGTNDASAVLGFDMPVESQTLAGRVIRETTVSSLYTALDATITLADVTDMGAGRVFMVTDGTNTEYFSSQSVASGTNVIAITSSGTTGRPTNNYAVGSKVQQLVYSDPDPTPRSVHGTLDSIVRWSLRSIVNQIDYSS